MKVLQISGTDRIGGAGIAAYRLHQGLQSIGVDSQMLVARKATSDPTVHRLSPRLNRPGTHPTALRQSTAQTAIAAKSACDQ